MLIYRGNRFVRQLDAFEGLGKRTASRQVILEADSGLNAVVVVDPKVT